MDASIDIVNNQDLEINADFLRAADLIDQGASPLFITGRAGTGKSTFLNYYRSRSKRSLVVLAPTGVAAVNVGGQTIHSFFNFKPDITPDNVSSVKIRRDAGNLYKRLQTIIIDEVSMARADLIDCIDLFLRIYGQQSNLPFGGVQLIFIGDLYQLPPVVTSGENSIFNSLYQSPYFFGAKVFKNISIDIIEFRQNYRQKQTHFMDLLDAVRNGSLTAQHLDLLNSRYCHIPEHSEQDKCIYLTTTNRLADQLNQERLQALKDDLFTNTGVLRGNFDEKNCPTHKVLDLKIGARIMLLNNDTEGRWVNGSIGKVTDIFNAGFNSMAVQVLLDNGQTVEVEPFTWELREFFYNKEKDAIEVRPAGSFKQFPMRLAWAITIHKSQGKTFTKVIIDVGDGAFCHGQVYVALSRCTSFEGVVLRRRISLKDLCIDSQVVKFMSNSTLKQSALAMPTKY